MMISPKVSVILPTLDEKENIVLLIPAILNAFEYDAGLEIIVVDDSSSDGTAEAVRTLIQKNPQVRLVERHERGLTSAIQRGISESKGDVICWMDVDFSHPPDLLPAMVNLIFSGAADAVVASRYLAQSVDRTTIGGGSVIRAQKHLSRGLSEACAYFLQDLDVSDWTSGFVAIRAEPLKKCPLQGDYGDYFIGLMQGLKKLGCKIKPIAYESPPRLLGVSKTAVTWLGLVRRGYKYLWALLKAVRKR